MANNNFNNLLLLKGFNNYFNRKVIKYSTLVDYQTASKSYVSKTNINFNPSDGVNTVIVLNINEDVAGSDYLIVYEGTNTIVSRWFILECSRERKGQYTISLKRDVVAENLDDILTADTYVLKGKITDINNPLLYNRESITVNQIKTDEKPIIDDTETAWLVGYIISDTNGRGEEGTTDPSIHPFRTNRDSLGQNVYTLEDISHFIDAIDYDGHSATKTVIESASLNNITMNYARYFGNPVEVIIGAAGVGYSSTNIVTGSTTKGGQKVGDRGMSFEYQQVYSSLGEVEDFDLQHWRVLNRSFLFGVEDNFNQAKQNHSGNYTTFYNKACDIITTYGNLIVNTEDDFIGKYNNALFTDGTSTYQMVINTTSRSVTKGINLNDISTSVIKPFISNVFVDGSNPYGCVRQLEDRSTNNLSFSLSCSQYVITAKKVSTNSVETYIPGTRTHCNDEVFDMFCIPYNPKTQEDIYFIDDSGNLRKSSSDAGLIMARYIMSKSGYGTSGAWAYDLQLLPYAPFKIEDIDDGYKTISLQNLTNHKDYEIIYEIGSSGGTEVKVPISFMLFSPSSNFTKNIEFRETVKTVDEDNEYINYKVSNECDFYRLCSPNYNGIFEFKLAKLRDGMHFINVDATYKPFSPYIKLNPDFSFLYGDDWNDSTGLICGGDFSLSLLSDQWINYQLNNKNYQSIFSREIQQMDINNSLAFNKAELSAKLGVFTGAISGATGGAIAGSAAGPYGAAAGAIGGALVGGISSAWGGNKDLEFLARQQQANRDYAVDRFNLQLGSIQALPKTVTKSSAFTYNNKVFPVLEYYTCKDEEKEILKRKLELDGMTINAIGNISDYISSDENNKSYIKGEIIRLNDVEDDTHLFNAIYDEILKGVYI